MIRDIVLFVSRFVQSVSLPYDDYRGQSNNAMYSTFGADGDDFTFTGNYNKLCQNEMPFD